MAPSKGHSIISIAMHSFLCIVRPSFFICLIAIIFHVGSRHPIQFHCRRQLCVYISCMICAICDVNRSNGKVIRTGYRVSTYNLFIDQHPTEHSSRQQKAKRVFCVSVYTHVYCTQATHVRGSKLFIHYIYNEIYKYIRFSRLLTGYRLHFRFFLLLLCTLI